ncbi:MAG: flagellar basal body rod protein FlgB [Thermotaleaceae bacterium]
MLNKPFGNITFLEKSLDALWMRNESIANNLANIDTPGYKREFVAFESLLKESMSSYSIKGKTTHENHMPIGATDIHRVQPLLKKDENSKYRKDGNNVNIDVEMANQAKTTIAYNMVSQRIQSRMNKIKQVIRDGR